MNNNDNAIRVVVNNNFHAYTATVTESLGAVLELGISKINYMSDDAILNWIREALEMAEETQSWADKEDLSLKKRITTYRKGLDAVKDKSRETIMNFFVNIAMGCAGMATLSGFGFANTTNRGGRQKSKGSRMVNPEKRTIYAG